jgi:tetratricopeptide (TPR) repeat protein
VLLAHIRTKLGKWLWALNLRKEASQHLQESLQLYRLAQRRDGGSLGILLANFLANCPDPHLRDPAEAVRLAEDLVKRNPQAGGFWNSTGMAHYRAGNYQASVDALEKATILRSTGGSFDFFFLAMAHAKLGNKLQAHRWFDKAVEFMERELPNDIDLRLYRAEAASLLAIEFTPASGKEGPHPKD